MISIMLYHQNWITEGFFFEWIRMLGYIGVEVFLFISGFGIAHSLMKNTLWQYYKNRVIRLMPACILFGLCKIVLSNIPTMPPVQNLFLDLFSLSQWYIYAIVVFYLFAPVVYKMINKVGGFFFVVIIITYIIICFWQYDAEASYLIKYGRWIIKRFPVFVFGMNIALKPMKLETSKMVLWGVLAALANVVVFRYIILANANPTSSDFFIRLAMSLPDKSVIPDNGRFILDMFSVLLLIPLFAFIAFLLEKIYISFPVKWIGKYSLEIYLCHQYIFKVVSEHFVMYPVVALVVSSCLSFVVAYVIGAMANPIKKIVARFI